MLQFDSNMEVKLGCLPVTGASKIVPIAFPYMDLHQLIAQAHACGLELAPAMQPGLISKVSVKHISAAAP